MYEIILRCEKSGVFGNGCHYAGGWHTNDLFEPPPPEFLDAFTEHGWVERDGKHYCELHNPDLAGERVQISRSYVEVAPGVRVRWPGAQQEGDSFPIEVKVEAPTPTKRTLDEWCSQYGVEILDFDGWRQPDAPAREEPITLADFYNRAGQCTIRNVASVDWSRIARDAKGS